MSNPNPNITKYEKARILAIRATQIAQNSKPKVELPEGMIDPLKIAEYEYKNEFSPLLHSQIDRATYTFADSVQTIFLNDLCSDL